MSTPIMVRPRQILRSPLLWLYVAPFVFLVTMAALPILIGAETLFLRDLFDAHLPMKHAGAEALKSGELPFVDPYRGGGQPLLGNLNAAPLYPDNLLFLAAPVLWAVNAHLWLHWLLAPLAMYALGRAWGLGRPAAWAAGVAYGTSGYFFSQLSLYNLIAGVALAPALAAAALYAAKPAEDEERPVRSRRWAVAAGLVWALLLLAGDPLLALLALAAASAALLARHGARVPGVGRLALALAAGTLVAAPQLIEFARILPISFRGFYGYDAPGRTAASWDPRQAVEWVVPFFFGRPDTLGYGRFWGQRFFTDWQPFYFSLYPGLLTLAAVAAAGRQRPRAAVWGWAMVVLGLFFSLGRFNPLVAWLLELPSRAAFRYPVKLWLLVALGSALLVGLGFERLLAGEERQARRRFLAALGALGLLLGAAWLALTLLPDAVGSLQRSFMPERYPASFLVHERIRWAGLSAVSLAVAAGLALAAVLIRRRPLAAGALLLLIHTAAQLYFQAPNLATDNAGAYLTPPPLLAALPPRARVVHGGAGNLFGPVNLVDADYPDDDVRWLERRTFYELYPFAGALWGRRYELYTSPEGLDSFLAIAAAQVVERAMDDATRLRLLSIWGVERLILPRPLDDSAGDLARPLATAEIFGRPVFVYELPQARPEVFFAGDVTRAPHVNAAVEILTDPGFRPAAEVVLPGDGPGSSGVGGSARKVLEDPNRLEVAVSAASAGVLIIQRTHLPFYRAWVDGREVPTVVVNLYRLGVEVPAGSHRVEIRVDRRPFMSGLAAAALGLLGLGLLLRQPRRVR